MAPTLQDDGSSSSSSSPLQYFSMMSLSPALGSPYPWLRELKPEERGLCLIHLLLTCGNHVAAGNLENANIALDQISHLASPDGDTIQRIASYFTEALANRVLKSWSGIYKALNSTRISSVSDEILVKKLFSELLPFLKVTYVISNQAILEAMEGEKMVHIIDLDSSDPAQWIALLQVLGARPDGAPHVRITGIHQQKEVLELMAHRLTKEAEKFDIPFQFNPVQSKLDHLDFEKLRVKTGEALAISSTLQLHSLLATSDEQIQKKSSISHPNGVHLQRGGGLQGNQTTLGDFIEKDLTKRYSRSPDSSSSSPISLVSSTKMDSFLTALWGLSPKIVVVAEQDSNHNGSTLMERLMEALYYYAALFDCLESTVPRKSDQRFKVEKLMFGEEIKNIIACENADRTERHEKLERWIQMLHSSGFTNVPLSYYSTLQARRLLHGYGCNGYNVKEDNGCLVICWHDRALYSVSAWRSRR